MRYGSRLVGSFVLRTVLLGAMLLAAISFVSPLAAEYKVDYKRSSIRFKAYSRLMDAPGIFHKWTFKGSINDDLQATGRLRINVASLDTKNGRRDAHLRNPDFFDVKKHPYSTFIIRKVAATGNQVVVTGKFTLHGVTKPLTIRLKKAESGGAVTLTGRTWIKRKAFKIDYDSFLNPIKDRVRLSFRIVLVKK